MEENSYIKRQRIYKTIMLVILTIFITAMVTSIYISNKLNATNNTEKTPISSIIDNLTGSGNSSLVNSIKNIEKTVKDKYLNSIDEEKAIEGAIAGYVSSLGDPYTEFIPSDEMEAYTQNIMGNFVGIGIYMIKNEEKNRVQVLTPIKDSPAEEAGLKSGDLIIKVDGKEYTGDEMTAVSNNIKGEEGTKVKLEILRGEQTLNIEITRRKVITNPVTAEVINGHIGYLGISSFDEDTAKDFKEKYLTLKEKNIGSLIIDLRDNGGGLVSEALSIIDYIVPKNKEVLITVNKNKEEEITKTKEDVLIDMPVVVLVNASTASASEILAGALQDLKEATIVGSKTYGKGVIQELLSLSNGSGLKITTEEYYTPNRTRINGIGITPDVQVELETSVTGEPTDKNDTQLNKAIQVIEDKMKQ